jgi:CDP-diacylglycerol--serine O-phosphatidyltransferase
MYIASLLHPSKDPVTDFFFRHRFDVAAVLIFLAMVFDALDGRLARFTRHTTDFGGQLDSLADVLSFGAAPAFLALQLFKTEAPPSVADWISRLVWAIGALYMSCAALRLARFNVSNEHGEQHHYSFLGLPSPGAGGAIAAFVLMHQELVRNKYFQTANVCLWLLPIIVLCVGLLMVSAFRYPHVVNRYLRGRRSVTRLLLAVILVLLLIVAPIYTLAAAMLVYAFWGVVSWSYLRVRHPGPRTLTEASHPA